ncbi:hypothetical protein [Microtetraspora niveoalba]|uniref:hypothetical protein n=1 Tax=Microtetraspora niveoalba TaxID=46175 RepID=UPI000836B0FF|nr:hypothetical protein [Microtetraspora niveoalba]
MVESGVTFARDLGAPRGLSARIRDEIRSGTAPGPRPLTRTNGHCWFMDNESARLSTACAASSPPACPYGRRWRRPRRPGCAPPDWRRRARSSRDTWPDLIAVDADPRSGVDALLDPPFVVVGGRVVKDVIGRAAAG